MNLQTTFHRRHNGNQRLNRVLNDPNDPAAGTSPAPSAAWLVAQLAFAQAVPSPPATLPEIVVRRSRIANAAETGLENGLGGDVTVEILKAPRVFLIENQKSNILAGALPSAQADLSPMRPTPMQPSPVIRSVRKRSVRSAMQIPGPVLQIYHAECASDPSVLSTGTVANLSPVQATRLFERLRLVARTLEDSERAADVSFVDNHEAPALQQLCHDLRRMRQQVEALSAMGRYGAPRS